MTTDRAQRRYENLLALRGKPMPETVEAGGHTWHRQRVFKHDFFAATGLYASDDGSTRAVLKIFRPYAWYGLPLGLLSRFQARHEEKLYRLLEDTGSVPRWLGRYGDTGFLHEFIPGGHLTPEANVPPEFLDGLERLIRTMHERGVSYLDTNKMHNVIVGDDGKCYLIDFQITWVQPPFPLSLLTWPLFQVFKRSDFYHLLKQRQRLHPQLIDSQVVRDSRPWFIKLHRRIANPIRRWRRAYLRKVETGAAAHPDGAEFH
jgi:hypothetical protein